MRLKHQAFNGVQWTTVSVIFNVLIRFIQLAVLARFLSPEDFGLMAMAMVAFGFAHAYTDLGISAAIIHRQDIRLKQLSSLYWLNIFSGLIAAFIFFLASPLIMAFFKEPKLTAILHVVSLSFIIVASGKQFEMLLQKELSFNTLAKQEMAAGLGGAIVAILCAVSGLGAWALVWGLIANFSIKSVLQMLIGFKRFPPSFHFRRDDLKGYLSFGLYQMGERSICYLFERLDQIMIGKLLGSHSLGLYSFAFNLVVQPILRINPIVTNVAFPIFSKIQNDIDRLRTGYIKVINFLTAINAPLFIGVVIVAPLAIPFIFGEKWRESIILVQLLSFVILSRTTDNPIGSLQLAKGRADLGFYWNLFNFFVTIPVVYLGAKLGEGVGVAVSLLVLEIIMKWPIYYYLILPLIGHCAREYVIAMLKPVAIAIGMGVLILFFKYFFILWFNGQVLGWPLLISEAIVGVLTYLFLLWLFDRETFLEFQTMIFSGLKK